MVTAIEYRAMALQHHRWAGMCRSPESREEHFRLEKEFFALADREERLHRCVPRSDTVLAGPGAGQASPPGG
jgi:hypothetical protein